MTSPDVLTSTDDAPVQLWGGTDQDFLTASGRADDLMLGEEGDDWYRVALPSHSVTLTLDEVRKYSETDEATDQPRFGVDVLDLSNFPSINIDLANVCADVPTPDHLQAVVPGVLNVFLFGTFEHVIGTAGNDTVLGNAADNILLGQGGDDYLDGREGNDFLAGGDGTNTLAGGAGNDTFRLSGTGPGSDTINDPSADDQDMIDLSTQPAGVRTLAMVSVGSCIFTAAGLYLFPNHATDPTRIAAQVVTGVGFLGAGAIFRSEDGVKGLTTAATVCRHVPPNSSSPGTGPPAAAPN